MRKVHLGLIPKWPACLNQHLYILANGWKGGRRKGILQQILQILHNSICNNFATTEDTKDQKTEPDRQCPTEHTTTNPTATPFLVVEIFSFKKKSHNSQKSVSQSQLVAVFKAPSPESNPDSPFLTRRSRHHWTIFQSVNVNSDLVVSCSHTESGTKISTTQPFSLRSHLRETTWTAVQSCEAWSRNT